MLSGKVAVSASCLCPALTIHMWEILFLTVEVQLSKQIKRCMTLKGFSIETTYDMTGCLTQTDTAMVMITHMDTQVVRESKEQKNTQTLENVMNVCVSNDRNYRSHDVRLEHSWLWQSMAKLHWHWMGFISTIHHLKKRKTCTNSQHRIDLHWSVLIDYGTVRAHMNARVKSQVDSQLLCFRDSCAIHKPKCRQH